MPPRQHPKAQGCGRTHSKFNRCRTSIRVRDCANSVNTERSRYRDEYLIPVSSYEVMRILRAVRTEDITNCSRNTGRVRNGRRVCHGDPARHIGRTIVKIHNTRCISRQCPDACSNVVRCESTSILTKSRRIIPRIKVWRERPIRINLRRCRLTG